MLRSLHQRLASRNGGIDDRLVRVVIIVRPIEAVCALHQLRQAPRDGARAIEACSSTGPP